MSKKLLNEGTKKYVSPSMTSLQIETESVLCYSGVNEGFDPLQPLNSQYQFFNVEQE